MRVAKGSETASGNWYARRLSRDYTLRWAAVRNHVHALPLMLLAGKNKGTTTPPRLS